jgi:hypothetical protein
VETSMDLGVLPITVLPPVGHDLLASGSVMQGVSASSVAAFASPSADAGASGGSSAPVDVVNVHSGRDTGTFTAIAGRTYQLGDLFKGGAPIAPSDAGYRVSLSSGDGQMLLDNVDVSGRSGFTAVEFARLTYAAGADGTRQSIIVEPQNGKPLPDGSLGQVSDGQAVQITASVSGTHSSNVMHAVATRPASPMHLTPDPPMPLSALATAIGGHSSVGASPSGSAAELATNHSPATGNSVSAGGSTEAGRSLTSALASLEGSATGQSQSAEHLQSEAIKAYAVTQGS